MNQNLTDRVGSPPILNRKGTKRNLNCKEFPETRRGPGTPPLFQEEESGNQEGNKIKNTQVTRLRDTQTNIQANPSIFHVQRSRVQIRQNQERKKQQHRRRACDLLASLKRFYWPNTRIPMCLNRPLWHKT